MASELHHGDCLEVMPTLPAASVDMVMADLPYGTTACKWDSVIPFKPLWREYRRVCKPNAAIALTASQPFTSALVMSNPIMFRYQWVWEKTIAPNFMHCRRRPGNKHEDIVIFYSEQPAYHPQMEVGRPYTDRARLRTIGLGRDAKHIKSGLANEGFRYPSSVIKLSNSNNGKLHPTQKPVALMEYLIRTYTNEGDTVLDNTMGSGTTGVACLRTGRNFIGIERDPSYFNVAQKRIKEQAEQQQQQHRHDMPVRRLDMSTRSE